MAIELPDAPDWVIGVGYVGDIQMVTPNVRFAFIMSRYIMKQIGVRAET